MQPDKERLTALLPDVILTSPYEGGDFSSALPAKTPIILCADYMETSALGRAEWMKFYALLWGKQEVADSLFNAVETEYLSLCAKVQQIGKRPRLICDTKQGASWPMPGGNSYLGQLFADAGADYIFAHRPENGTAFLSLEEVIAHGLQSEVWLIKYGATTPLTYAKLSQDFPQSKEFLAYKNRNIWGCNTFHTAYYDEVPFHPERLLRDLISLLHPELLPGHEMLYYSKMTE
jgi:iron complex transport system substrate-binding protein